MATDNNFTIKLRYVWITIIEVYYMYGNRHSKNLKHSMGLQSFQML
jgi:hypothetical protein